MALQDKKQKVKKQVKQETKKSKALKTKIEENKDNFIFKYLVYIRVKEFKTNKEVIINTQRILYTKEIDKKSSLIMMNSGYKVRTNLPIDNLWQQKLCKQVIKERKKEHELFCVYS